MLISFARSLAGSSCLINYKVRTLTTSGARGAVLVLLVPLTSWDTLGILWKPECFSALFLG